MNSLPMLTRSACSPNGARCWVLVSQRHQTLVHRQGQRPAELEALRLQTVRQFSGRGCDRTQLVQALDLAEDFPRCAVQRPLALMPHKNVVGQMVRFGHLSLGVHNGVAMLMTQTLRDRK